MKMGNILFVKKIYFVHVEGDHITHIAVQFQHKQQIIVRGSYLAYLQSPVVAFVRY